MRKIITTSTNAVWGLGDGKTIETVICASLFYMTHISMKKLHIQEFNDPQKIASKLKNYSVD